MKSLGKYFVTIVEDKMGLNPIEDHHSLTITRKQYAELLCCFSKFDSINELLKCQIFSCGKCLSFSVTAQPLYSALNRICQYDEVAEIISNNLKISTDIDPWYFEMLDQPDEMREKALGDHDNYHDIQHTLRSGDFVIEGGVVFQFPYEECAFVFDENCTCNRIFRA